MNRAAQMLEKKLTEYLASVMPGAEGLEVSGLSGVAFGASRESFTFDASWEEGGEKKAQAMVLRRDLPTGLLDHIPRETEFKILKSLEDTGVPAPRVFHCESDPKVLQRPFIIMERVDGLVTQAFQKILGGVPAKREKIATQYVEILAAIHNLDWKARGFDFLDQGDGEKSYADRELAKWGAILDDVMLEPDPVLTEARIWLRENAPADVETCLVHGDYKMDNVMYKKDEIVAIFDWEMATLGDPHDDLGWVCMRYYEVEGLIQGIMDRDWFIETYQRISGRKVDPARLRYWQVFSNVKMAAITLTGAQRWVSGKSTKNVLALLPLLMPKLHQDIIELLEF